jgi:hypothetical protein
VVAGDHHAAVEGEACEDSQRGIAVEEIVFIEIGHVFGCHGIGRHDHV